MKEAIFQEAITKKLKGLKNGTLNLYLNNGSALKFGETENIVADLHIYNSTLFRRVIANGTLGAAESYMLNEWDSPDLTNVIRLIVSNLPTLEGIDQFSLIKKIMSSLNIFFNKNNISRAKKSIYKHYDLGNDFFKAFLDKTLMYSSAIFTDANDTLYQAQINRLQLIGEKLQLSPTDHLLEIGSGWGGLAIYMAQNFGCKVTTATISKEQFEYLSHQITELGLSDKITLLEKDYRDLTGTYDKLVSVEMIEAVGHHFLDTYFSTCNKLLKPGGLFFLQAIVINDRQYERAKNEIDFIKKYIFPNGCLPSNYRIAKCIKDNTDFHLTKLESIAQSYVKTLQCWLDNFNVNEDTIKQQSFDEKFIRMWKYYFCYCKAGFLEHHIDAVQMLLRKH